MDERPVWLESIGGNLGMSSRVRVHVKSATFTDGTRIELAESGVVAIVGANNSGKSTFLNELNARVRTPRMDWSTQRQKLLNSVELGFSGSQDDFLAWLNENSRFEPAYGPYAPGFFQVHGGLGNTPVASARQIWAEWIDSNQLDNERSGYFFYVADGNNRFQFAMGSQQRNHPSEAPQHPLHRMQDRRELFTKLEALSLEVFNMALTLDEVGTALLVRLGRTTASVPRINESRQAYADAIGELDPLDQQGDGMKAFFSLFIPLVAATYPIIMVDEPEAFLHPPQAFSAGRAIGKIASEASVQVILATHDKDFLAGVLASETRTQIIRLNRGTRGAEVQNIPSASLRDLWDHRTLRYGNVLSGLFHKLVVVCEAEQDCHFYQAALEDFLSDPTTPDAARVIAPSDVLFVPTNGKSGIPQVVEVLRLAGVSVVVITDVDVLDSGQLMQKITRALGANWDSRSGDYEVAMASIDSARQALPLSDAKLHIERMLDEQLAANPRALVDGNTKSAVSRLLSTYTDKWDAIKRGGIALAPGEAIDRLRRLFASLVDVGFVPLENGVLESFAPQFSKGREWLPRALDSEAHRSEAARMLIKRVLHSYSKLSS